MAKTVSKAGLKATNRGQSRASYDVGDPDLASGSAKISPPRSTDSLSGTTSAAPKPIAGCSAVS